MMVVFIIILIIAVCFAAFLTIKTSKETKAISLKEALDLTGLPIVTFKNNSRNFNFLLDTGSNDSYVDSSILGKLDYLLIQLLGLLVMQKPLHLVYRYFIRVMSLKIPFIVLT